MHAVVAKRLAPLALALVAALVGAVLLLQSTPNRALAAALSADGTDTSAPASQCAVGQPAPATGQGIEDAVRQVWPQDQWVTAWAVQRHESGGRDTAFNPAKGGHKGRFQISNQHDKILALGDWTKPLDNARMAKVLWDEAKAAGRDPWQPWESYTAGHYRQYLDEARAAMAGAPAGCVPVVAGDSTRPDGSNGKIDAALLCRPRAATGNTTQSLLTCPAAQAFDAMAVKYAADMGKPICWGNGYRSYAEQVALKRAKPSLAAVAGTSNHGWGLAVDLCDGVNIFGTKEHEWLVRNAAQFGWVHPKWAQRGGSRPEPWHWEYGDQS